MKRNLKMGLAALAIGLAPGAALAEWPAEKPITFVIPYGPGGGFDTIVRVLAPELEARLGTVVTPENIPGASGTRGGQAVARADADGYTIGIYNIPGLTVSQATDTDIGFELDDVTWIANIASDRYAIAVKSDSPVQSLKDLCDLGRPIRLSDTGFDSTSSITAVISFSVIGCEIQNVTGYSGSNETMIAVLRGEVDATLKPINSLQSYVESGDMRLIATLSEETLAEGVPTTTELGYPEVSGFGINRVVGGPPNMPADVVKRLSDEFMAITASESFVTWAEGSDTGILALDSTATTALMSELSAFYAGYADVLLQTQK
ncbi:tripartite tricarboxylate transporter substrate binding protein [Tabrizicola sp. WMC-M-20]|nr:tripartite tricarboxylate transporter substrate binding protein [Tabrizicola sp. WMC-M-20]